MSVPFESWSVVWEWTAQEVNYVGILSFAVEFRILKGFENLGKNANKIHPNLTSE